MSNGKQQPALPQLADYLEAREGIIIQRWVESVRRAPDLQAADEFTYQQLVNHLPIIYRQMIELLRHAGGENRTSVARQQARIHGQHRWQGGYRLAELLREIDILRQILLVDEFTDFMQQYPHRDPELEKRDKRIIGGVLAELTNSSVQQFTTEAEQQIRQHNGLLTEANERLQQVNERLQELDEARMRLMRQLAHELNNLLNGIYTPVALLAQGVDETMGAKMIEILRRKTGDMASLVRDLLSYSTLLAGRDEVRLETVELAPLCHEMEATFKPTAEAKGLAFAILCDATLSKVTSDPLKLKQIITNLLSNAIKYTTTGYVTLTLGPAPGNKWAVLVEDSGPGIAAEELPHIFAEFHRTTPRPEAGGTGLGLAITKQLVDILGGEIHVTSEPGRGSRFDVTLPRVPSQGKG